MSKNIMIIFEKLVFVTLQMRSYAVTSSLFLTLSKLQRKIKLLRWQEMFESSKWNYIYFHSCLAKCHLKSHIPCNKFMRYKPKDRNRMYYPLTALSTIELYDWSIKNTSQSKMTSFVYHAFITSMSSSRSK